jgi:hypothetical protein
MEVQSTWYKRSGENQGEKIIEARNFGMIAFFHLDFIVAKVVKSKYKLLKNLSTSLTPIVQCSITEQDG